MSKITQVIQQSKEELIEILQDPSTSLVETCSSIKKEKSSNEYFLTYSCLIKTVKVEFRVNPSLQNASITVK